LTIYDGTTGCLAEPPVPELGFIPSRPSLRTRLEHWLSGHPGLAS
jgi:hypothetical protein